MNDYRHRERMLDAALLSNLTADEGGPPPVAERDLDLGEYTIRTSTNHTLDYASPTPDQVRYADMLSGLASEPRYAGQSPRTMVVAEHLVLAARIAERMPEWAELPPADKIPALYACLMHDAAEGYCKDIPGPLKRLIGEPYRVIERAVEQAIFARFHVVYEPYRTIVKAVDRLAYLVERRVLFGWREVQLPEYLARDILLAEQEGPGDSVFARALPWPSGPSEDPARAFTRLFGHYTPHDFWSVEVRSALANRTTREVRHTPQRQEQAGLLRSMRAAQREESAIDAVLATEPTEEPES